ncbi:unnamed protein product, partial [Onchocerca ochengi]|uniref:ATP-dependent DNA helicase n=1 Tax=Onchocerca ochengi TaxID=42157 RepID=A0A182ETB9_ONCOC
CRQSIHKSVDTVVEADDAVNYTTEFLNSFDLPGMPQHMLTEALRTIKLRRNGRQRTSEQNKTWFKPSYLFCSEQKERDRQRMVERNGDQRQRRLRVQQSRDYSHFALWYNQLKIIV